MRAKDEEGKEGRANECKVDEERQWAKVFSHWKVVPRHGETKATRVGALWYVTRNRFDRMAYRHPLDFATEACCHCSQDGSPLRTGLMHWCTWLSPRCLRRLGWVPLPPSIGSEQVTSVGDACTARLALAFHLDLPWIILRALHQSFLSYTVPSRSYRVFIAFKDIGDCTCPGRESDQAQGSDANHQITWERAILSEPFSLISLHSTPSSQNTIHTRSSRGKATGRTAIGYVSGRGQQPCTFIDCET